MVVMWLMMPVVALCAALWWWLSERARWHRLWLDEMHGAGSDTLGVGLSILVVGECSLRRYEALLGVEYARLEVVAVVDGSHHQSLFEELVARYHLIRVGYRPSGELPAHGVQGLYRSRRRRYRRFVLLDCRAPGADAALDATADVAAHEYLLPLRGCELPAKGVIEALVTEVALRPMDSIDQICLAPTFRTLLWRRTALVRVGGFGRGRGRVAGKGHRLLWWENPLRELCCRKWRSLLVYSVLLILLAFVWGLAAGRWMLLSGWLLTLLFVLLVRMRMRQMERERGAL